MTEPFFLVISTLPKNKKHLIVSFFACCTLLFPHLRAWSQAPAAAVDTTILAVSDMWDNYTAEDGTGVYWDILREIYTSQGYQVKPQIQPYSRSILSVERMKADVVLGVWARDVKGLLLPLNHVEVDVTAVAWMKKSWKYAGPESLSKVRVGYVRGYDYNAILREIQDIQEGTNTSSLIQMLKKGRVDVLIDSRSTLEEEFKKLKIKEGDYHLADEPDLFLPIYFAFVNSPKGKVLLDLFEREFPKIKRDGRLANIYKRYALPPPNLK